MKTILLDKKRYVPEKDLKDSKRPIHSADVIEWAGVKYVRVK